MKATLCPQRGLRQDINRRKRREEYPEERFQNSVPVHSPRKKALMEVACRLARGLPQCHGWAPGCHGWWWVGDTQSSTFLSTLSLLCSVQSMPLWGTSRADRWCLPHPQTGGHASWRELVSLREVSNTGGLLLLYPTPLCLLPVNAWVCPLDSSLPLVLPALLHNAGMERSGRIATDAAADGDNVGALSPPLGHHVTIPLGTRMVGHSCTVASRCSTGVAQDCSVNQEGWINLK